MKHEVMARAITELDSALLEDAQQAGPKAVGHWRRWCAAAACLVLVCALALPLSARPAASLRGTALTARPTPVEEVAALRAADPGEDAPVQAELTLTLRRETGLTVSAGTLTVLRDGAEIGSGSDWTGKGRVTVLWSVGSAQPGQLYTLTAGSLVLTLEYDDALQGWTIRKGP